MSSSAPDTSFLYIGLMSGTSLDGVDGVLASIPEHAAADGVETLATAYIPFPEELRAELMTLQASSTDELHRAAVVANHLVLRYAQCVAQLLTQTGLAPQAVRAIGSHGQTIRHRPECGYTLQLDNPALLAELTGIDVIADFRRRDIAAGGQGAPLVPAFHQFLFSRLQPACVVVNIGGISNISILNRDGQAPAMGFDTGPGNVLMDLWIVRHQDKPYDSDGNWAASGRIIPELLTALCEEGFFRLGPPKSTGRDLFHASWLANKLAAFPDSEPPDVQATLAEFTACTIAQAIADHAKSAQAVYVCGGGAYNRHLMIRLQHALHRENLQINVSPTDALGVPANQVEALAFAWLAHRFACRQAGNLPAVTGAKGPRTLGALYPA